VAATGNNGKTSSIRRYSLCLHVVCIESLASSNNLIKLVAIRQGNGLIANGKYISKVLEGVSEVKLV
jgi:hypothetical protein